jgi:hypothetical protein
MARMLLRAIVTMRTTTIWLAALSAALVACGGPNLDPPRKNYDSARPPSSASRDGAGDDADGDDPLDTTETPAADPPASAPTAADADLDGVPDDQDCDAKDASLGARLLDEALATDGARFAPATGFPTASWAYGDGAYRQSRLVAGGDATFFAGAAAIGDVDVTVDAASTEVTSAIAPRLRQLFVLVGASSAAGAFSAYGCGAEVVQGLAPEQRTSVVKLSGSPSSIATTPIARAERAVLQANEGFSIRARLHAGTLTCTVTQGGSVVTTAEADGLGAPTGAVGFFTSQTKAAFTRARICEAR